MNQFDILVQEQLLLLDESWKDSANKYAAGAALGAAGLLGLQHGLKDTRHNHDLTRTKIQQQQSAMFASSNQPSKANVDKPIKAKHNINEYKTGLMARFHNTEVTAGNAKPSPYGTYKYTIMKEIGDMYPHYQMVRVYDINDNPIVTIRFSKDGSEITNIFKRKLNVQYPEKMKSYMKSQFGIDL